MLQGADIEVILQVRADAGQIVLDANAVRAQLIRRADARQQQQLRRIDRAAAENHLARLRAREAAMMAIVDADGAMPVAQHALRLRMREHGQIRAIARRAQVARCGGAARAVALRGLIEADALLLRAVEIGIKCMPAFLCRGDERIGQRVVIAQILHTERPARTVQCVGTARIVLRALEVGQRVLPVPAFISRQTRPLVVVARVAADVAHRIDRA